MTTEQNPPQYVHFGRFFLAPLLPRYDEAFGEELNDALTDLNEQLASGMPSMFESLWSAITESIESQTAIEIQDEFKILQQELLSVPHMLAKKGSGATAGFEEQIQLMWLLIVNHDIGLLHRKLLGGVKCLPAQTHPDTGVPSPLSDECKDFHKHCLALEALDLIVLHSEVTLAMAKLEPSWALALYEKTMLGLEEAIHIIGEAQWVCMNAVDNIQDPHNQHEYGQDIYNNMQPKLDFLLISSGRYESLFSYQQTATGYIEVNQTTLQPKALMQSMSVPPGVGSSKVGFGRSLRYYVEQSQIPEARESNWPIYTINGTYRGSKDRVPDPDPTLSANIYVRMCLTADGFVGCKCHDGIYPSFLNLMGWCVQPLSWTTPPASHGRLLEPLPGAMREAAPGDKWLGCPPGMFITGWGPTFIQCHSLVGVGWREARRHQISLPAVSLSAERLQRRLAADPEAVERAAAATGVVLRPEHHRQLHALLGADKNSLLKTDAKSKTRDDHDLVSFLNATLELLPLVKSSQYYDKMGEFTTTAFDAYVAVDFDGEYFEAELAFAKGLEIFGEFMTLLPPPLAELGFVLDVVGSLLGWMWGEDAKEKRRQEEEEFRTEVRKQVDEAMGEMYNAVMDAATTMSLDIWHAALASVDRAEIFEINTALQVLSDELYSMPSILSTDATGSAAGFEAGCTAKPRAISLSCTRQTPNHLHFVAHARELFILGTGTSSCSLQKKNRHFKIALSLEVQLQLMWLMMLANDVERAVDQLLGGPRCLPETFQPSAECVRWRKHCTVMMVPDLLILYSQLSLAMARLEPSWSYTLRSRTRKVLNDAIPAIDMAKWACMNVAPNSTAIYMNIQRKLPSLMKMTDSYEEYFSYPYSDSPSDPHYAVGYSNYIEAGIEGILSDSNGQVSLKAGRSFQHQVWHVSKV